MKANGYSINACPAAEIPIKRGRCQETTSIGYQLSAKVCATVLQQTDRLADRSSFYFFFETAAMNKLVTLTSMLMLVLLMAGTVDGLVWSLVLGNPVIDMKDESSTAETTDSLEEDSSFDIDHPRNTKLKSAAVIGPSSSVSGSRPTRQHHGQVNNKLIFFSSTSDWVWVHLIISSFDWSRTNVWRTSSAAKVASVTCTTASAGRKSRPASPAAVTGCAAKVWPACTAAVRPKYRLERRVSLLNQQLEIKSNPEFNQFPISMANV